MHNTIYFKGKWQTPFSKFETDLEPFHLSVEEKVDVLMMNDRRFCRYGVGKGFRAISIPYRGRRTSMVVFLPDRVNGLPAFEKELTGKKLKFWLRSLALNKMRHVKLYLPKFKFNTDYDLVQPIKALGVKDAFSHTDSDFRSMGKRKGEMAITQIQHKAIIEVDEEGTKAVAVSASGLSDSVGPYKPPTFVLFKADRPFLFLIRDNKTGTILFMGRVADPRPGVDAGKQPVVE